MTHPILISCETATIGFIYDVFKNYNIKKQYKCDNYFIDLYFIDFKIAIECDELHHKSKQNKFFDKIREETITNKLKCEFYRYSPDTQDFKLSTVIRDLLTIISKK